MSWCLNDLRVNSSEIATTFGRTTEIDIKQYFGQTLKVYFR